MRLRQHGWTVFEAATGEHAAVAGDVPPHRHLGNAEERRRFAHAQDPVPAQCIGELPQSPLVCSGMSALSLFDD